MDHSGFMIDENQREILVDSTWEFPYSHPGDRMTQICDYPWHWHPGIELVYVVRGTAIYYLPGEDVIVPPDGVLFINSEVYHTAGTVDVSVPVEYRCQNVDPSLLSNGEGSLIKTKYVDPIVKCADLPFLLILPGTPLHEQALGLLKAAYREAENEDFLYEYRLRQHLTQFWLMLIEHTQDVWRNPTPKNDYRSDRIKKMMIFIQERCTEKLTLEEIAASADISTRECLRCFKKLLRMTPFEFLTDCRVRRAADMLQNSSSSITDIALHCGFSSVSYFCRTFKKLTGESPSEYKQSNARKNAE